MSLLKLLNLHVIVIIIYILEVNCQTNVRQFSTPGNYSVVIPANIAVTLSMWGAGGAGIGTNNQISSSNAVMYPGGSGAFVSCTINAPAGSTIYLLVGGGGSVAGFGQNTTSALGGGGKII